MTIAQAREWLVKADLALTAFVLIFFLAAPAFKYPLDFPQSFRLLQIVLPVFTGYLATATQFVFHQRVASQPSVQAPSMVVLLVKGPLLIFALSLLSLLVVFAYANRLGAEPGEPEFSINDLALGMSLILSVLAASTATIVSYLFSVERK